MVSEWAGLGIMFKIFHFCPCVHSLSVHCVPGSVLGTEETAVKTGRALLPQRAWGPGRYSDQQVHRQGDVQLRGWLC